MFKQHLRLAAAVTATAWLVAGTASAQATAQAPQPAKSKAQAATPAAPPQQGAQAQSPPPSGPQSGPPPGRALQRLNLTQAQKDQLRAFREQQQKDGQALRERMRSAREKLREAMRADIPDEVAVRAAAGALAAVQADRFAAQARNRAQTMKLLTPEQQTQLKDIRSRARRMAGRRMMIGQERMMRGRMMRQQMMRRMRPMMRQQMMRRMHPVPGEPQPMRPGAVRRWII